MILTHLSLQPLKYFWVQIPCELPRGEEQRIFQVRVANQSVPLTLSTVLVFSNASHQTLSDGNWLSSFPSSSLTARGWSSTSPFLKPSSSKGLARPPLLLALSLLISSLTTSFWSLLWVGSFFWLLFVGWLLTLVKTLTVASNASFSCNRFL